MSLDFMSHVIFGSSANRQIGIPSPLHGPGLDSQLTEVSEASITSACLLERRILFATHSKKESKRTLAGDDQYQSNIRL